MPNITLSVEDDVIKKVRKIAIDQDTTLTAMVRDYLYAVARQGDGETRNRLTRLEQSFEQCSRGMGTRTWTRDELHER
jgi:hypothetical protein